MRTRSILACLLLTAAVGCKSSQKSQPQAPVSTAPPPVTEPMPAQPQQPQQTPAEQQQEMAWCPTQVPGTTVEVENTDVGAALVFHTEGDVAEVRRRVVAMADAHNAHQEDMARQMAEEMPPDPGTGVAPGDPGAEVPPADPTAPTDPDVAGPGMPDPGTDIATGADEMAPPQAMPTTALVVPIEDGARLEIATTPESVDQLQAQLRTEAQQLETICDPALQPATGGAPGY